MMHAGCIEHSDAAEKDTVSRDSITGKEIKVGLLHHWNIKKTSISRQSHASVK